MTPEQMSLTLAMLVKPFIILSVLALLLCVRFAIIKYFPESRLKRLLLIRLNKPRR
jgi:hypothetical protein